MNTIRRLDDFFRMKMIEYSYLVLLLCAWLFRRWFSKRYRASIRPCFDLPAWPSAGDVFQALERSYSAALFSFQEIILITYSAERGEAGHWVSLCFNGLVWVRNKLRPFLIVAMGEKKLLLKQTASFSRSCHPEITLALTVAGPTERLSDFGCTRNWKAPEWYCLTLPGNAMVTLLNVILVRIFLDRPMAYDLRIIVLY